MARLLCKQTAVSSILTGSIIALWCNGNTQGFDPCILSSILSEALMLRYAIGEQSHLECDVCGFDSHLQYFAVSLMV